MARLPPAHGIASVLGVFLSLCCARGEAAGDVGRAVRAALSRYAVSGARVGVCVRRLPGGKEVFAEAADGLFEIASNAKLFTTAAALERLGPDYRFRTRIVANGAVVGGVLSGDLLVIGGGDPTLSGRFFNGDRLHVPRWIARSVAASGVRVVTGDLVMDDRFFDRVLRPPGWPEEEWLRWYAAPVSALSYNDNCLDIAVTGARTAGAPVRIVVRPQVGYGKIVNAATTCASRRREGITFRRNTDGSLAIGGRIRAGHTRGEHITVENPPLFLAAAVRKALAEAGVEVRGTARLVRPDEDLRADAREIAAWETDLVRAVEVANRRSQNLFAEQILKTLGAERRGKGTWENGLAEVHGFCAEIGLPRRGVALADGSGLSPGNRATPRAVVALLVYMHASDNAKPFHDSLAVNGDRETTLRNRLTEPPYKGRIFAKTGTVKSRGVSALSGYAHSPNGALFAFSIITNGSQPAHVYRAKKLENAICRALLGETEP